jgi:hypothetical protein
VLDQRAQPDDHLPVLGNSAAYYLCENNERGVILNAAHHPTPNTQLDGFFIYKGDKRVTAGGDTGDIYTLGSRLAHSSGAHWQYAVEGALQWGRRTDLNVKYPVSATARDIAAYGGTAKATYAFKDSLKNQVSFSAEYFSGDKAGTAGKDEMFDVLWGRYPRVGEIWNTAYTQETAGRLSQNNNLLRLGTTWAITPCKDTTLSMGVFALFAPEAVPTRAINPKLFSQSGHVRGQMLQVVARRKFTPKLSGLLWLEGCSQGNFYNQTDTMVFMRGEMLVTF